MIVTAKVKDLIAAQALITTLQTYTATTEWAQEFYPRLSDRYERSKEASNNAIEVWQFREKVEEAVKAIVQEKIEAAKILDGDTELTDEAKKEQREFLDKKYSEYIDAQSKKIQNEFEQSDITVDALKVYYNDHAPLNVAYQMVRNPFIDFEWTN
jgi:phenylalanyl-tRNA synthetase alpha subunit